MSVWDCAAMICFHYPAYDLDRFYRTLTPTQTAELMRRIDRMVAPGWNDKWGDFTS